MVERKMKDLISSINKSNLKGKIKVYDRTAPVSQDYADEIETDGYASDAAFTVDKAKKLLSV